MYYLLSSLIGIFTLFLYYTYKGIRNIYDHDPFRGDEFFYHELMEEGKTITPFHYRWLMPFLAKKWPTSWRFLNWGALILTTPLLILFLQQLGTPIHTAFLCSLLFLGCYGSFSYLAWNIDEFVDPVANFLSLLSATLCLSNHLGWGLGVALLSATVKETAPIIAGVLAMSPVPFLGLGTYVLRRACSKPRTLNSNKGTNCHSKDPHILEWQRFSTNPLKAWKGSLVYCSRLQLRGWHPSLFWGAWGAGLLGFWYWDLPVVVATITALGLSMLCTDRIRALSFILLPLLLLNMAVLPKLILYGAILIQFLFCYAPLYSKRYIVDGVSV